MSLKLTETGRDSVETGCDSVHFGSRDVSQSKSTICLSDDDEEEEPSSCSEQESFLVLGLDVGPKRKIRSYERKATRSRRRTKRKKCPRVIDWKSLNFHLLDTSSIQEETYATGWVVRNIVSKSKENQSKLTSSILFASFDQRDKKANGKGACSVIATVIAHWLRSNQRLLPTVLEFENLIIKSSAIWRNLCDNQSYVNIFPNNHFDLETVLEAKLNPIKILTQKSFTGFFDPKKFEHLKELTSFDDIWSDIIQNNTEESVYIVSWSDHFFVLKMEVDAYYIIDSFGERLLEGCNQAYILKFDDSSLMYEKLENGEEEVIVCRGKECCKEYINRFLAHRMVRAFEEEEKRDPIPFLELMRKLQIDFHYMSLS